MISFDVTRALIGRAMRRSVIYKPLTLYFRFWMDSRQF
jgi:hypothetical protein